MDLLLAALLFSVGANLVMFVPAFIFKTDKLTDISYAVTFIAVATFGFLQSNQTVEQLILWLLVLAWALRLGTFLFIRINKMGRDKRFDGMRDRFFGFMKFWLLQGVSVFIVMLAPVLLWKQSTTEMNIVSVFGILIFSSGLLLEATADYQKFRFNNVSKNKGRWIESGVWSRSRHPNYLGEMMVWSGIFLFCLKSFTPNEALIALISPVYIICLLLFVSGVPLLEKAADARWGKDKAYQTYKKRVPVLIPRISRS